MSSTHVLFSYSIIPRLPPPQYYLAPASSGRQSEAREFIVVTGARDISVMMGFTMIIGIITKIAIFYFSEFQALEAEGHTANDLIEAGINKMSSPLP
jgi:hypothetical protein